MIIKITDPLFEELEKPDAGQPGIFTIKLNVTGNTGTDSVSFDNGSFVSSIEAESGQTITIYYTLANTTETTDQLTLSFASTSTLTITTPATATITYPVKPQDAINGTITIEAEFLHTSLIVLDPPTGVSLLTTGAISFTAGGNNGTAGSTYTYTLFKDGTSESSAITLENNIWVENTLIAGSYVFFRFPVTSGQRYWVTWNDSDGDGTKTCDLRVSAAYQSNSAIIFSRVDLAWTTPQNFLANQTGYVVLVAEGYNATSSGVFKSTLCLWWLEYRN